jgi:hypothetical protein
MKTIVIIGDSFGVPNYSGPPGISPEYHVEYLLKEMKYDVVNLSANNTLNATHLSLLEIFIANNPLKQIDFVVWFHNCAMHLIGPMTEIFTIDSQQQEYLTKTYKQAVKIKQQTQSKWFVVGGSSPVPDFFYHYNLHNSIIPDWRSQILNEPLPFAPGWHSSQNKLVLYDELNRDSEEYKKKVLGDLEFINKKLRWEKSLFPDGCHPGMKPHHELAQQLDVFFKIN